MKSHSQAGQDEWVHSIVGDSGYFVDVGAHDGVTHSNTYALEQCGWAGVCVEPNRDAFAQLCANRPNSFNVDYVISDPAHWETINFDGVRVTESGTPHRCMALCALLGNTASPKVIDYLSIDVEGHELEVLSGMAWTVWHVRLITIEHNLYSDGPARKNAIYNHLAKRGFERVREDVVAPGYGPYEDWYRHRDD